MEHEHFTFPEAIKFLKKYNIEVEEIKQTNEQKEETSLRESIYTITDFAQSFYSKTLKVKRGKISGWLIFKKEDLLQNRLTDSIWDIHPTSGML